MIHMTTILYARVSTVEQTIKHQEQQAIAAGYKFDHVIADHGVSGVNVKMKDRPEGRRLFDLLRTGDVLVVRWVDRLGRNYLDVTDTIRALVRRGVIIKTIINNMVFDGSATDAMTMAVRDALIGFMAASAQAQAEVMKEAQKAGIAFARTKEGTYRGRKPSFDHEQLTMVSDLLQTGRGISDIAKEVGLSRQTVHRLKANPVAAEAILENWT